METHTNEEHTQTDSVLAHETASPIMQEEKSSKTISVKTAIVIAALIVVFALAFYYKGLFVAATVNGSPVSRLSVISELEKSGGKKALDTLVTKKLLNDAAKKAGIVVTSDEISAEVAKIEDQVKAQGGTLDEVLSSQGMTRADVAEQVTLQKKLEKLLADKIQVTDEEAAKLLVDSKITVPKGEEEKYKEQAREQIRSQKLNDAAGVFIDSLRTQASVRYFVNY